MSRPRDSLFSEVLWVKAGTPSPVHSSAGQAWGWSWELETRLGNQGGQEGGVHWWSLPSWGARAGGWPVDGVSSPRLRACPPRAGMPCLASAPACTLSSAPLLMTSTRSCPSWGLLRSPQQGKGMSSAGRRRPSVAGPCKPSRSVHSRSCRTTPGGRLWCARAQDTCAGHPGWHDPCWVL